MPVNAFFLPLISIVVLLLSCSDSSLESMPTEVLQYSYEPLDGKKLFILGQSIEKHMEDYITSVKSDPIPAGFAFYTSLSGNNTVEDMVRYIIFLNKYPNTTLQLAIWTGHREFGEPGYYLDEIVNGDHDSSIIQLASALNSIDRPVYIRFGYEFDGLHNSYPPDKYIAAYKYFVDLMREQNVNNVAYVWHSWGVGAYYGSDDFPDFYPNLGRVATQELWYPGDDYVDWVALSIFGNGWGNLNTNSVVQYLIEFAESRGKPIMLAETAAIKTTNRSDPNWVIPNSQWFQNVFSLMENNESIKALTYINVDWEGDNPSSTWGDTRIQEATTDVRNYWVSKIQSFLHADEDLFNQLGY